MIPFSFNFAFIKGRVTLCWNTLFPAGQTHHPRSCTLSSLKVDDGTVVPFHQKTNSQDVHGLWTAHTFWNIHQHLQAKWFRRATVSPGLGLWPAERRPRKHPGQPESEAHLVSQQLEFRGARGFIKLNETRLSPPLGEPLAGTGRPGLWLWMKGS